MADAKMLKKVPVREQDPKVRATNFEEVCLGYNQEEAMARLVMLSVPRVQKYLLPWQSLTWSVVLYMVLSQRMSYHFLVRSKQPLRTRPWNSWKV